MQLKPEICWSTRSKQACLVWKSAFKHESCWWIDKVVIFTSFNTPFLSSVYCLICLWKSVNKTDFVHFFNGLCTLSLSLSFSVSLSRADADPKPSPHCYSLHKSLHLCTSTRDGRYSIKAFPVWWLWPPPFYARPFVTNRGPIALTLPQHECVLIMSLTAPHTFFFLSGPLASLCYSCTTLWLWAFWFQLKGLSCANKTNQQHWWLTRCCLSISLPVFTIEDFPEKRF